MLLLSLFIAQVLACILQKAAVGISAPPWSDDGKIISSSSSSSSSGGSSALFKRHLLRGGGEKFDIASNLDAYIKGFEVHQNNDVRALFTPFKNDENNDTTVSPYKNNNNDDCYWSNLRITCPRSPLYLGVYDRDKTFLGPDKGRHTPVIKFQDCLHKRKLLYDLADKPLVDLLDIVIIASDGVDLELLLQNWEIEIKNYHSIIIVDDTYKKPLPAMPTWLRYEVHTSVSLRAHLGSNSWLIGSAQGGLGDGPSMAFMGGWISLKEYVYVIYDHNKPSVALTTKGSSSCLNVVESHMFNVLTPAIDDYRHCIDNSTAKMPKTLAEQLQNVYIRKPVISLEIKDSQRTHGGSYVMPLGTSHYSPIFRLSFFCPRMLTSAYWLFTPSSNQLYDGSNFSEYAEVAHFVSNWMLKLYLDWYRAGVKVVQSPPLSSLPSTFNDLPTEFGINFDRKLSLYGLQEDNKRYFVESWARMSDKAQKVLAVLNTRINSFNISKAKSRRNNQCGKHQEYSLTCFTTEISKHVFGDPGGESNDFIKYMYKLSTSHFQVWSSRKALNHKLFPVSIKSYTKPKRNDTCAVITISHNEKELFPIWFRYYSQHFNHRDMFILDHMTTDGSLSNLPKEVNLHKFNVKSAMPIHERSDIVRYYQDFLLRQGYKCIVFSDVDEIIAPDPLAYPGGLKEYLQKFVENESLLYIRVKAFDLVITIITFIHSFIHSSVRSFIDSFHLFFTQSFFLSFIHLQSNKKLNYI
jgi:hypothetical protein